MLIEWKAAIIWDLLAVNCNGSRQSKGILILDRPNRNRQSTSNNWPKCFDKKNILSISASMIIYPPYPPSAPRPLAHLPRETSDCADQIPLPAYTATWPVLRPPHQAQGLGLCWAMPRSCGIPKFPKQKLKDYKTLMWFNDHHVAN